jgi:hypothetical protein
VSILSQVVDSVILDVFDVLAVVDVLVVVEESLLPQAANNPTSNAEAFTSTNRRIHMDAGVLCIFITLLNLPFLSPFRIEKAAL